MAITNTDIVIFQSQDNTDNENGGGARTSTVLSDGAVNNLFPDISRIDATAGDVALRKIFPTVNTTTRDIYFGAHAIIRKTPDDDNVNALLFYTDDSLDVRSQAQNDIEAYVVPSFRASFYLFGNNIEGSRAVTFLQRLEETLPTVGQVLALIDGAFSQFIRIRAVESQEIILTFNNSDFRRRRIICTIEQPLERDLAGSNFRPQGQEDNTVDTFETQVADAARFYGTTTLQADASMGETTITVTDVTQPVVPSTRQQTPIINNDAFQNGLIVVPNPNGQTISQNVTLNASNSTFTMLAPVVPNTWIQGGFSDDGNGNINDSNGVLSANIQYATGILTWVQGNIVGLAQFTPGSVSESRAQFSQGIEVTTENQGSVYILNVAPVPDGVNTYVDYRSGGRWNRIQGNNDNTLGQDVSVGAGLITDNGDGSATITVTLGSNPDIDSTIIFSWGSDDFITDLTTTARQNSDIFIEIDLPNTFIDSSTATFSYLGVGQGGGRVTIDFSTATNGTVNVNSFNYRLDSINGRLLMRHDGTTTNVFYPNFTTGGPIAEQETLLANYSYATTPATGQPGERTVINNPTLTFNSDRTQVTFSIGENVEIENVQITSLAAYFRSSSGTISTGDVTFTSDASGILRIEDGGIAYGTVTAAGAVTINIPSVGRNNSITRDLSGSNYVGFVVSNIPSIDVQSIATVEYTTDPITVYDQTFNGTITYENNSQIILLAPPVIVGEITFNITTNSSFGFDSGDSIYSNNGNLFRTDNNAQVGTIDYNSGRIVVNPSLLASAVFSTTNKGRFFPVYAGIFTEQTAQNFNIDRAVFRTASEDLVTSSLIVRYTTTNGTFTATTDANGMFTGTDIDTENSSVDTLTGVVFLEFTAGINPNEIFYDAVAQTTLPLDPELLGLNPVRLPPNGEVPIFVDASIIVIFSEQETMISPTPVAGATFTIPRSDTAYVEVVDVNGQRLDYAQFTADRANNTITFADPLSLQDRNGDDLTGPYRLIDRVEDMAQVSNVEITGQLQLSAALSRDYSASTTFVASALVWGDIGARVFNLFSQQTFDVWSNDMTTAAITAQYNNIDFPIQVQNNSSFTGRWAMIFTSSNTVNVVSEVLGTLISNASITADISPTNAVTNQTYFTIPSGGWGTGWITGNVLRFNTESGGENMWVIRTVQAGALSETVDSIDVEIRGDSN